MFIFIIYPVIKKLYMRIGVFLESHFYFDKDTESLYCVDPYILVFDQLFSNLSETQIREILYMTNLNLKSPANCYKVNCCNRIIPLTPYKNLVQFTLLFPYFIIINFFKLVKFVKDSDKVIIMAPSINSILILFICRVIQRESIILIRQDIRKMVSNRFKGINKILGVFMANFLEVILQKIIKFKQFTIVVSGSELQKQYIPYTNNILNFADSKFKSENILNKKQLKSINWANPLKFLYVGRIEPNKGLIEMTEALKLLENDFELMIVGTGSFETELRNLLKGEEFSTHKISFKGYIPFGPDLMEIYQNNDILILPSYSEGLPQVILEAMANGCLVLSTAVGGIPAVIKHGVNGFLFNPKDVKGLYELISGLIFSNKPVDLILENGLFTAHSYCQDKQLMKIQNLLINEPKVES